MVSHLGLHSSVLLQEDSDRAHLDAFVLHIREPVVMKPALPFPVFGDDVADQARLFVTISPHERLAVANKRVLAEVAVDIVQLDAEATDLDLIIGAAHTFHIARVKVSPEIARAVHSVSWAFVISPPGLVLADLLVRIDPLLVVDKPVHQEFLLVQGRVAQITPEMEHVSDVGAVATQCTYSASPAARTKISPTSPTLHISVRFSRLTTSS